jgi:hypothetical protein
MTSAPDRHPPSRHGAGFWIGLVVGWSVMAYGVWGFIGHVGRPVDTARWIVGTLLVHDALVAPAAAGVGLVVAAVVPQRGRGPIAAGLAATGVVLAFSYPLLRGFGRRADNPSILPLDYTRNVVLVVTGVWVVAALSWLARRRRDHREPLPPA